MKHWPSRIATVGLAAATAGIWLSPTAAGAAEPAVGLASANGTSTAQAGYILTTPPASSSVKATFSVPTLTCTSTNSGIAIGAFVFSSTQLYAAAVFAECTSGTASYTGVLQAAKKTEATTFTPAPGDVIKVSASLSASSSTVTLKDISQSQSATLTKTGGTPADTMAGMDALSTSKSQLPVPDFGTVSFSKGKIDGETVAASGAQAFNMETSGGVLQIKTSALDSTGRSWTETFKHS